MWLYSKTYSVCKRILEGSGTLDDSAVKVFMSKDVAGRQSLRRQNVRLHWIVWLARHLRRISCCSSWHPRQDMCQKFLRCYFWPWGLWGTDKEIISRTESHVVCHSETRSRPLSASLLDFWPLRRQCIYSPDRQAECGPTLFLLSVRRQDESATAGQS